MLSMKKKVLEKVSYTYLMYGYQALMVAQEVAYLFSNLSTQSSVQDRSSINAN